MTASKESLTLLRKYFFESTIFGLVAAVVFLFHQYAEINNTIQSVLIEQAKTQATIIEKNTATLQRVDNYFNQPLKFAK